MTQPMIPAGLLISAPASGTGKTTLMLGLLAALRARGVKVQPFKSGPDYIDPAFHTAASGRASVNLDSWAMSPDRIAGLVSQAEDADLILAEGSMGLFDGVASKGETGTGASADIAAMMGWPVILVLDVSGQAQSAAAVALGFTQMRPEVRLAGVVLNRVASPRHEALVRAGMAQVGIPVLAALPRNTAITMPERHLGLVQAQEHPELDQLLAEAGRFIADHIDLDALLAAASGGTPLTAPLPVTPPAARIALARDAAFSFVYPHLIQGWRAAGAEILPFSPLDDQAPDPSADLCWLPGGYPELHAGRIAANQNFLTKTRAFAAQNPCMANAEAIWPWVWGWSMPPARGMKCWSFWAWKPRLPSAKCTLATGLPQAFCPIPRPSTGHEFHYATILNQPDAALARVTDATGTEVPKPVPTASNPGAA